jgi:hypothetical protein
MFPAFTWESCDKANYICGRMFIFLVYIGIYVNISPVLLVTRSESLSLSCLFINNTIFLIFDNYFLIVSFRRIFVYLFSLPRVNIICLYWRILKSTSISSTIAIFYKEMCFYRMPFLHRFL